MTKKRSLLGLFKNQVSISKDFNEGVTPKKKPRQGWDKAFKKMVENKDDKISWEYNLEHRYKAKELEFTKDKLCLTLSDGREIRVPIAFYPRLKNATKAQRENFRFVGGRTGIHWPDIDEDLSVNSIVLGYKGIA